MKPILTVLDAIAVYSGRLFAFLSIPVIVIIMVEVIARYVFSRPFTWSHEAMTFLSAFLYILGGGYVLYQRGHVSIDILHQRLSVRWRAIMDIVASLFFFLYMSILIRTTFQYAATSFKILERSGSPWNPPVYPVKIAILIAVILIFLAGIGNLIRDFHTAIKGREGL